jgi:hypothetical protein
MIIFSVTSDTMLHILFENNASKLLDFGGEVSRGHLALLEGATISTPSPSQEHWG